MEMVSGRRPIVPKACSNNTRDDSHSHSSSPFRSSFAASRKPLPPIPAEDGTYGRVTAHSRIPPHAQKLTSSRPLTHSPPAPNLPQHLQPLLPEACDDDEETVVALYDFEGSEPHDLSLVKGGEYVIVERCDVNWYKARNQDGYVDQLTHF